MIIKYRYDVRVLMFPIDRGFFFMIPVFDEPVKVVTKLSKNKIRQI